MVVVAVVAVVVVATKNIFGTCLIVQFDIQIFYDIFRPNVVKLTLFIFLKFLG